MLLAFLHICALHKDELTPANVEPMDIVLLDPKPIFARPKRFNRKLTEFIDLEVARQMKMGLIRRSKSPYAARLSLAPKGDSWRMCCNYAPVNKKIKKDRHPL